MAFIDSILTWKQFVSERSGLVRTETRDEPWPPHMGHALLLHYTQTDVFSPLCLNYGDF